MEKHIELLSIKNESGKTKAFIQFRDVVMHEGKETYCRSILSINADFSSLPEACDILLINEEKLFENVPVQKFIADWKKTLPKDVE